MCINGDLCVEAAISYKMERERDRESFFGYHEIR